MPFSQRRRRTFDDVNVLYLHHTDPAYIAPPRFGRRQLTGGPFMPTSATTLRTPGGHYDLPSLLKTRPADDQPDILIVWADATRANLPSNLGRIPCVRVLMVGDTHHLDRPLEEMIDYARSEPFDLVLSAHNRQHLHFFREAGLRDVAWLPNVEADTPAQRLPAPTRLGHLASSGQIGDFHPARRRLIDQLTGSGLPLRHRGGKPDELAVHYGEAVVALNGSLNGDVNLRVAEVLAAGGCLLTDRLSPQSGIDGLLEDGQQAVFYRDAADAVDQARALLHDPDRALAIARRGWERQVFDLGFAAQRRRLLRLIEGGPAEDGFRLDREWRCVATEFHSPSTLRARLALYQHCQEINRVQDRTTIGLRADVDPAVVLDLIDLHRCHVLLEEGKTAVRLRAQARFAEVAAQMEIVPPSAFAGRSVDLLVAGAVSEAPSSPSQAPEALWLPTGRLLSGAVAGYRQDGRVKELFRRGTERGAA